MSKDLVSEAGYVLHKGAVSLKQISRLHEVFLSWQAQSKSHKENFGEAANGKYRCGIGLGHSESIQRLIRVKNTCDISDDFNDFIKSEAILGIARLYLGESIRFHHCKINTKYQGGDERIDLHQDFCFDPHTNRSLITLMIPLVDVDEINGALAVVPGSQECLESHFEGGTFQGKITDGWNRFSDRLVKVSMDQGDVLVSDGWLIHGSLENNANDPRPALFMELSRGDALPLAPYHVPSRFSGDILSGDQASPQIRLEAMTFEVPAGYKQSSIVNLQQEQWHASKNWCCGVFFQDCRR